MPLDGPGSHVEPRKPIPRSPCYGSIPRSRLRASWLFCSIPLHLIQKATPMYRDASTMSRAELLEELRALMFSRVPDDVLDERHKVIVMHRSDRMLALSTALNALPGDDTDG
jgi:hypothetical protein